MKKFSVAIDGPAGSGKSTLSKSIAKKFGFIHIDTGAMYRTVALYCIQEYIDMENEENVKNAFPHINIDVTFDNNEQKIFLNGDDVTDKIRNQAVAKGSSQVALMKPVRDWLVNMQRELAKNANVVMDGRDIGTCVLKEADIKIYLTASEEARAKRRISELRRLGIHEEFEKVKNEIKKRDYNDTNREHSPLRKAEDAIELDTTYYTANEALEKIAGFIEEKMKICFKQ